MVAPGEIVAVAGVEGNGQSELGAVLSGMLAPTEGRFFLNGQEMTGRPPPRAHPRPAAVWCRKTATRWPA